ncbi:TolC family protein [Desulforhopalus sp. 52FAK]
MTMLLGISHQVSGNILRFVTLLSLLLFAVSTVHGSQFIDTAIGVLAESPQIHIARQDMEIAASEKKIVRASYLPQLSLNIEGGGMSESYSNSGNDYGEFNSSVELSQDLINIPQLYQIRSSDSRYKKAAATFIQAQQDILLELALNWSAYWKSLRRYETGKKDVEILSAYLNGAKIRFEAGDLTITDVWLAESKLHGSRSKLLRYTREVDQAKEALQKTTGKTAPKEVDLIHLTEQKQSFPSLVTALEYHPKLQPLLAERTALEQDVKREKAGHLPTLATVAHYTYQPAGEYDSDRYPYNEGYVGLELQLDLYSGGKTNSRTQKALGSKIRQGFEITDLKRELTRNILTAKSNYNQSGEELHLAKKRLEFAQKTLEGMIEEFDTGTRTSVDVFLSQAEMTSARLEVVDATEQHNRFIFNYLHALGLLNIETLQSSLTLWVYQ